MTKQDYEIWYEGLSTEEQAEILEAYTTMVLKIGTGDFDKFLKLCYKIMKKVERNKFPRAFKQAEKVGNAILGKRKER